MNKTILMGRLTKDVETKHGDTTISRFNLAVDRKFKTNGDADFIPIVAFGKIAEFCEKYFKKGMKVLITGRIQTGNYTDKEGNKHYTWDVVAEDVEFAESKKTSEENEFADIPNNLPFI